MVVSGQRTKKSVVNILIVAPAWVGDMVMAHSLVNTLQRDVDVQIDMLILPGP